MGPEAYTYTRGCWGWESDTQYAQLGRRTLGIKIPGSVDGKQEQVNCESAARPTQGMCCHAAGIILRVLRVTDSYN